MINLSFSTSKLVPLSAMSTGKIIEAFYERGHQGSGRHQIDQNSDSTSSNNLPLALDEIDNKILLKDNVDSLHNSPDLFPYIYALFVGSKGNSKESLRRLGKLFNTSIVLFKQGKFEKQEATELLELMFSVIRQLSTKQTDSSILNILKDFSPDPLSESNVSGHGCVLQLVPQLVSRNGESLCRTYTLEMICEMTFPVTSAVVLCATLVDLCETEDDLRKTIDKIKAYVKWNPSSLQSTHNAVASSSNHFIVDPEDLPALIYQLTSLSRKFDNSNDNALISLAKVLIIDALTDVLDLLFHEACHCQDVVISSGSTAAVMHRIHNIMSTIVHHLSLLVSKDKGISSEIVKLVKCRRMLIACTNRRPTPSLVIADPATVPASSSSQLPLLTEPTSLLSPPQPLSCRGTRSTVPMLSPSRLLLALLAAKAPRLEDSMLHSLCESIHEVYVSQSLHLQSLWFGVDVWAQASQSHVVSPSSLHQLFTQILSGSLMVEGIVVPLMKYACGLLHLVTSSSNNGLTDLKSFSCLSSSSLAIVPCDYSSPCSALKPQRAILSSDFTATSASEFGAWLLIQLFTSCRHARLPIIREVVQRLQMVISSADAGVGFSSSQPGGGSAASSFTQSSTSTDQLPLEKLLLGVLRHLTSSPLCLEGILESAQDFGERQGGGGNIVHELMELFLALPSLSPRTAGQLVDIMAPVLRFSSGLADRCTLSLRKASFSKDVNSRISAVSALMTLLRIQLSPPSRPSEKQSWTNRSGGSSSNISQPSVQTGPWPQQSIEGGDPQPVPGILSIEEMLSLCRRFLHHQAPVRSLLYDRILQLHCEVPCFRSLSIRLLRTHLHTLTIDDDSQANRCDAGMGGRSNQETRMESKDILSVESPRHLLFLNLDTCMDSGGQTQEALYDLIITLTSMVKSSCGALLLMQLRQEQLIAAEENSARASQRDIEINENEDSTTRLSQVPCTQYGYFSQVDLPPTAATSIANPNRTILKNGQENIRRSQRRLDEFAKEVDDTFLLLWKLCCGLARGKPSDFSLPLQPSTRQEYKRFVVIVEALQAALNCVASLPAMPSPPPLSTSNESIEVENCNSDACFDRSRAPRNLPYRQKVFVMQFLTPVHRIELFAKLAQQLESFSVILLAFRKQEKEVEKSRGKKGALDQAEDSISKTHDEGRSAASSGSLALPKLLGGFQSPESLNVHCVEVELELCVFGLEALFMRKSGVGDEDDDGSDQGEQMAVTDEPVGEADRVEEEKATFALRGSPSSQFLRKHLLERSLYCLEIVLKYLGLHPLGETTGQLSDNDKIISQCHQLFQCLMRVLIKMRSEDKENSCELGTQHQKNFHTANNSNTIPAASASRRGCRTSGTQGADECSNLISTAVGSLIFLSSSHHQYLYPNQLVLRCMLGCLRAEKMHSMDLCRVLPKHTSTHRGLETCSDVDHQQVLAQLRTERLTVLLEDGFRVGHSGSRQGVVGADHIGTTNGTAATGLTLGGITGTMRDLESRLEKQAKKFLDLFLLLSSPEGTERNESPLVICLLGEVVQVLSPARRQKFQEHLLKKCKDHLHSPSNAITLGLLQLLVFKMPTECKGRVDILRRLCSVVTECCTNEQQLDEDEDEGDQHDFDKSDRDATTYTLVSRSTAATAITALVGMLEKLCGEMDILLKLSIKTSKVGKTSGAPSLIGSGDSTISDLWGEDVMDTCTANDMCAKEESEWRVNDHICRSLNNAMDIALSFLSFKSAGVVSHGILALFLKMVKLHVKITKLVSGSPAAERQQVTISQKYRSYRDLALNVATNVSQHLNRYITEVHNILDDPPGRQKKKGSASGGKAVHAKLSRLIPELIFQTEEIDLNVIKLMTGLKERDKSSISKWLCKVAARDFRLTETAIPLDDKRAKQSGQKRKSNKSGYENRKKVHGNGEEAEDEDRN